LSLEHSPRGGANRRCDCDGYRPDTLDRNFESFTDSAISYRLPVAT
jgi:hypothetical protein